MGFYDRRDPDPESGKEKVQDPGMNIPDLNFENLILVFGIKNT